MTEPVPIELTVAQIANVRAQFVAAHGEAAWMTFRVVGDELMVPAEFAAEVAAMDPDHMPAPTKAELLAHAADKRWRVETGGIAVGGASLDTSRESQSMITGAYSFSQANPTVAISYKAASGWVVMDAATVAAIATAVGTHVQASFAAEAAVAAAIEAGTITTVAQIDAADWP